jgi:CheY-like chemotaxis protein
MSKLKVLIVEDDEWLVEQYESLVQKNGYKVKSVNNVQAAIDAVDDFSPNAIVLDILLAGSNAFTFLHELQSYKDICSIPIIICSNLSDNLSLEKLKPYGVRRLLDKAIMAPEDLIAALRAVL